VDFAAGYEALLARWPVEVERLDVRTRHGTTRINAGGPPDGMPLVLLSGFGTTSAIWYANVGVLAEHHRVYALDRLGDRGLSVYDGQPITDRAGLMSYLDNCLDELGADQIDLCGHSYGGWTALRYAQHAPRPGAAAGAARPDPVLHRASVGLPAARAAHAGAPGAGVAAALPALGERRHDRPGRAGVPVRAGDDVQPAGARFVFSKQPTETELRAVRTPTLVLLAGRGRQHHNDRVAAIAKRRLPDVEVRELPVASHHTIPFEGADDLNRELTTFLA
jgi:pimeloyl-ACP methyl ester carboxylesterase